ncbi:MAG: glycosyltransferase [Burkholderiales bacterium]|nr:glycosyltransferase [Burkholderiales bacterium]
MAKIAIVHDYLCGMGGSERIFQYMCEEFPEADIYALAHNPDVTYPYFSDRGIRTTWMNRFVQSMDAFRWSFPISTYVMESLDLSGYDIVLSSSATVAKYVKVPDGTHVCYCYIPTRAIWHFDEYFGGGIKGRLFGLLLPWMKKRDYAAAQRVDRFIAISDATQDYIRQYYDRESEVIHSPIDLSKFSPSLKGKDHYLLVSRLEYWKRVDYAVEAFNKLGLPLRIIGTGKEEETLQAMAGHNITFLGSVDDAALAREYAEAKAVVFTPFLEYGLIPLEANASGTPVICYGKGGITETMVPLGSGESPTAVFFFEQTAEALIEAVRQFEAAEFDKAHLVRHASNWGVPEFKRKIRAVINSVEAA